MKAVEQTFSQWCVCVFFFFFFFFSPLSPPLFLSPLICFDTLAADAWHSVGDRLKSQSEIKARGKCNYSSGSQQFCKKDGCTRPLIKARIYQEDHKSSPGAILLLCLCKVIWKAWDLLYCCSTNTM